MIKKILLGMFFLLIICQVAAAAGDKLLITDIDVEVDGKTSKNLEDGDRITKEAGPESEIDFKIEVKNNFTDDEGLEIEDIKVEVTIKEIDDDDHMDEEAKEFDLDDGRDKKATVSFKLPLEIDEGSYDVVINIEGEDTNGTEHSVTATLELEVEKETHELRFYRKSLNPTELSCQSSAQLSVGVINTGTSEEDEVILEITNSDLELNLREVFDLTDDPFDSDSKFSKVYTIRLPDETEAGVYSILTRATYDDGDEVESDTIDMVVNKCERTAEEEEEAEEEPEVVVISPEPTLPADNVVTVTEPTSTTETTEQESLLQNTGFVAALIVGEMFIVIVAVLLVVLLMRRKD